MRIRIHAEQRAGTKVWQAFWYADTLGVRGEAVGRSAIKAEEAALTDALRAIYLHMEAGALALRSVFPLDFERVGVGRRAGPGEEG